MEVTEDQQTVWFSFIPQNSIYVQQKKETHLGLKQLLSKWWYTNKTPWQNQQTDGIIFWGVNYSFNNNTFTFMHLVDAFTQSDLQCIQAIAFCQYVCSLGIEPTTFCAANAMLTEPQEH